MRTVNNMNDRRWFKPVLAGAFAALLLLVIPISYERTTGHTVTMDLAIPNYHDGQIQTLANELADVLEATELRIEPRLPDAGRFALVAKTESTSGRFVKRVSNAFAAAVGERGIDASASIEPVRAEISSNAYAFGRECVLRLKLDTAGRFEDEIEEDIRRQLIASGCCDNPQVSYSDQGEVKILSIENEDGSSACIGGLTIETLDDKFELEFDGDPAGDIHMIKMEELDGLSDAEKAEAIKRILSEQGLDWSSVTVEDGLIDIQAR
ncbi:MAG: hypothetical protein HKN20_06155 [Gemmatimonadetes bacterium]|nr:hypothetical protein [Gemmatimonadota bacterium]